MKAPFIKADKIKIRCYYFYYIYTIIKLVLIIAIIILYKLRYMRYCNNYLNCMVYYAFFQITKQYFYNLSTQQC